MKLLSNNPRLPQSAFSVDASCCRPRFQAHAMCVPRLSCSGCRDSRVLQRDGTFNKFGVSYPRHTGKICHIQVYSRRTANTDTVDANKSVMHSLGCEISAVTYMQSDPKYVKDIGITPISVIFSIRFSSKKHVCEPLIISVTKRWVACDFEIDYCSAVHHLLFGGSLWNLTCSPPHLAVNMRRTQGKWKNTGFFLQETICGKIFHSFQDTLLPPGEGHRTSA